MEKKNKPLDPDYLCFIPLGGSEQFGVNLNVYAFDGAMLAIDCGIGFADDYYPGVDILLPDPVFLEKNKQDLLGMVITHAHEDHVGAVAYLWRRLECPLYATEFTAEVLKRKLQERQIHNAEIRIIASGKAEKVGPFALSFINVAHSIPGAVSVVIETRHGRVLHSGDWNLDPAPVIGNPTDEAAFRALGKKGVLAYVGDSTNADSPGYSGAEKDVEKGLAAVFAECKKRIAVAMFSSNIGRMKSVVRAAAQNDRQVCVVGRSLHRMISCADECGYLDDIPDFIAEQDIAYLPEDKVVMIVTGSQGEPRAALSRIAQGNHPSMALHKGDTVIFSARAIPGNETQINRVKNNLTASGIKIITPRDTDHVIHVSGHPCQEEIAAMYQWVRPKIVVPVHGEHQHLVAQSRFAKACQIDNTIVPNNGSVVKLAPGTPEIIDHVETGLLAVDQKRLISSDHQSIAARRKLQYSGVVHVTLVVDDRGNMIADPRVTTEGLIDPKDKDGKDFEDDLYNEVLDLSDEMTPDEKRSDKVVSEEIRIGARRFVHHVLGMKPKVTVHVVRV